MDLIQFDAAPQAGSPNAFCDSLQQVLTMRDLTPLQATFQLDVAVLECDSGETHTEPLPPL